MIAPLLILAASLTAQEEEPAVKAAWKVPPSRSRMPVLRLEGTSTLPEGAILRVALFRLSEQPAGLGVHPLALESGGGLVEVLGRRFRYESMWQGPGLYRAVVTLSDQNQRPEVLDAIRGKYPVRAWKFEAPAWDDELASQLGPGLRGLGNLVAEAGELIRRYERASETESAWAAERKALLRDSQAFLNKLERTEVQKLYPAAHAQVYYSLRNVQGSARYFSWKDGKFAGAISYHDNKEPAKTYRQETFTYDNFRRYLDEAVSIAGREFALWVIKEARRGGMREPLLRALRENAQRTGVAPFAERLEKAPDEADPLETEIRGVPKAP